MIQSAYAFLLTVAFLSPFPAHDEVKLTGEGIIVAVQKTQRYRKRLFSDHSIATAAEVWIVRVDRWEEGQKNLGYFLVSYRDLYRRALTDKEINSHRWRIKFREPIFHEAEHCAAKVPVPLKDGTYEWRPPRMEDFELTNMGKSKTLPALKDLPCLIVDESPTIITRPQ